MYTFTTEWNSLLYILENTLSNTSASEVIRVASIYFWSSWIRFQWANNLCPANRGTKQERVEISNRCLSSNFILLLLFSSPFYCLLIYLAFLFSLWKPAVSMAQRATTLLPGSAPELEHFFWAMQALEKGKGQPWYLLVQHWTNVTRLLTLVMPETELSVSEEIKLRSRIIFELFSLAI